MLRKLVLCLSVACLAKAAYLDTRAGGSEPGDTLPGDQKSMTPEDLAKGIHETKGRIHVLQENIDKLTSKVIQGGKDEKEWTEVMTHMADVMKGTFGLFLQSVHDISRVTEEMFKGDHGFRKVTRCTSLDQSTNDPEFGKKEFIPQMEVALAKDLVCFSNLLKEAAVMKVRPEKECEPPSEDDVIEFASTTFRDLFRLRNDGERFFHAVALTTHTYSDHFPQLHGHFMHEMSTLGSEDLVRELIRALGKN